MMDELPKIPEYLLEEEEEFNFIRSLTTICAGIMLIGLAWYAYQLYTGEINLIGPAEIVLERDEAFDSLIQLDSVGDLDGSGVAVCIVDSGISLVHPDLSHVELSGWKDVVNSEPIPYDDHGHGTMMAGILVADGGLRGVAPNVDLYVAKALSSNGSGEDSSVAEAIDWCISNGVNIISLSLGGASNGVSVIFGDAVEDAVDDAYDAGIVVVAAAGNDGQSDDGDVASPGTVSTVICVGAVNTAGNIWEGSSRGDNNGDLFKLLFPRGDPDKKPEVVAPGEGVPVLFGDDGWGMADGTSGATVYVSGAVALMFENKPELMDGGTDMLDDLKQWIMDSSLARGDDGHDDKYGYGVLQIENLIAASQAD